MTGKGVPGACFGPAQRDPQKALFCCLRPKDPGCFFQTPKGPRQAPLPSLTCSIAIVRRSSMLHTMVDSKRVAEHDTFDARVNGSWTDPLCLERPSSALEEAEEGRLEPMTKGAGFLVWPKDPDLLSEGNSDMTLKSDITPKSDMTLGRSFGIR
jgi:hypothetical protein